MNKVLSSFSNYKTPQRSHYLMLHTISDAKKAPLSMDKQINRRVKGISQICLILLVAKEIIKMGTVKFKRTFCHNIKYIKNT